jgi:hypothetical protein
MPPKRNVKASEWMRKETSAGIIAGAVSAFPVGMAFIILDLWDFLVLRLGAYWTRFPDSHFRLLVAGAVIVLMILAFPALLGALCGLIFVALRNRLPFHSTYAKATAASIAVWLILSLAWVTMGGYVNPLYPALAVLDSLIFAYLFDRWTGIKATVESEPFIPRPD